ncbi:MAG: PQQ-dependent dehydrogenase, methanol/ethanol family [Steroidobacteraceae bacterium]
MGTKRLDLRIAAAGLAVLASVAGCTRSDAPPAATATQAPPAPGASVDDTRLAATEGNDEWLSYGRSYSEQRHSPLKQIDRSTVGQLGLAWYAEFEADRGMEATPLLVDGVLYNTTSWSHVYAIDARTGAIKWHYDPKVDGQKGKDACCDVVNRGVALWKGKVYVGALDGRLIALDAATGKELWSQQTTDPDWPYTITGAPRIVKGKVLIGNGGAELGVRGFVSAYDAETGNLAWRFFITPNPEGKPDGVASDQAFTDLAAATWHGEGWKKTGGGGTPWDSIVYDPQTDLVYIGTGNGSPWSHQARSDGKGDNLFLSSILALKPDTGEYAWHYQTTPGDSWDYTAVQQIMTADLTIDGAKRHVVMQAPKNGFFYVLDASNGKLLSAEKFVPVNWAQRVDVKTGRPVENALARYPNGARATVHSGPSGAHNWHPMSFDPSEGLVYLPATVSNFGYQNDPDWQFIRGKWNLAEDGAFGPPNHAPGSSALVKPTGSDSPTGLSLKAGQLIAWDPVKQQARWKLTAPTAFGGTLVTAGGLVFAGNAREFAAYSSTDGTKLWSTQAAAYVMAAPMTYQLDGQQYVAVNVGYGGAVAMIGGSQPRRPGRLYVFKLGGAATAPEFAPHVPRPRIDVKAATASTGDAKTGANRFANYCGACHIGGVFTPDLLTSPYVMTPASFKSVVHEGALRQRGMANFSSLLSEQDVENIRAYLLGEAAKPPAPPRAL